MVKGGINIFCSGKVDNNKYMQVMQVERIWFLP
jgi:hypothetical protein